MSDKAFESGQLVEIWNHQHIWHREIGIVRDNKPGMHRVEFGGSLRWIPTHWLVEIDENEQPRHNI